MGVDSKLCTYRITDGGNAQCKQWTLTAPGAVADFERLACENCLNGTLMKHVSRPAAGTNARRVLIIHNVFWAHYKAAVFAELYSQGAEQGLDCFVIHVAATQNARAGMPGADIDLHHYPHKVLFEGSFNAIPVSTRIKRLVHEIWRFDPDVVVVPGYDDAAWWASLYVGRRGGAKIIVSVDSTIHDHARQWFRELFKRIFLAQCQAVFGYGQRSREYCLSLGVPTERIFIRCQATQNSIIRDGFLAARATAAVPPMRPLTFGYVGRLSPEKNLQRMISAYQHLFSDTKIVPWRLLLVGAGAAESELRVLASRTPNLPIEFRGGVSWQEVPRCMSEMDVVILPSLSEPWGLVINEALLCERAVIVSTTCGCVPELVSDGRNGFIFDPADELALKEAMARFVANPQSAEEMGRRGLAIISDYTPAAAAKQMLAGINYVIGRKEASP